MKRFRMHKQKVVKPDGRWMYLYTFEEEPSVEQGDSAIRRDDSSAAPQKRQSTEVEATNDFNEDVKAVGR